MKTNICFENEEKSCQYNAMVLNSIRQMYRDELTVMVSAGDFSSSGVLLRPSCKERSEEYVKAGADAVLSLPVASVLGGFGKKEFAGAALVQRLHSSERLIIPCVPAQGQTVKELEKELRSYAMLMFREESGYRRKLTQNLNDNMPLRDAQLKAVCDCIPQAQAPLKAAENRYALWLLDAMLQLYYMPETVFIEAPAAAGAALFTGRSEAFERSAAEGLARILESGSGGAQAHSSAPAAPGPNSHAPGNDIQAMLIDISGSTTQMVTSLIDNKESIQTAESIEKIIEILQPESSDRIRLFVLKTILGLRKIYMQICGLHVYVPYCHVAAVNPEKAELCRALEEKSWVPFVHENGTADQKVQKDYYYLLEADRKADELVAGRK